MHLHVGKVLDNFNVENNCTIESEHMRFNALMNDVSMVHMHVTKKGPPYNFWLLKNITPFS